MAIRARCPGEGLLHHSDRGVQYACGEYQAVLERHGVTCSMSRSGNCYDNASMGAGLSGAEGSIRIARYEQQASGA